MVILAWWIVLALEAIRLWPRLMAALQGMQHAS